MGASKRLFNEMREVEDYPPFDHHKRFEFSTTKKEKPYLEPKTKYWDNAVNKLSSGSITIDNIKEHYQLTPINEETLSQIDGLAQSGLDYEDVKGG